MTREQLEHLLSLIQVQRIVRPELLWRCEACRVDVPRGERFCTECAEGRCDVCRVELELEDGTRCAACRQESAEAEWADQENAL